MTSRRASRRPAASRSSSATTWATSRRRSALAQGGRHRRPAALPVRPRRIPGGIGASGRKRTLSLHAPAEGSHVGRGRRGAAPAADDRARDPISAGTRASGSRTTSTCPRACSREGSAPLVARAAAYARLVGRAAGRPGRRRARSSGFASPTAVIATRTFVDDTLTPVRAYAALRQAAGDARLSCSRASWAASAGGASPSPATAPLRGHPRPRGVDAARRGRRGRHRGRGERSARGRRARSSRGRTRAARRTPPRSSRARMSATSLGTSFTRSRRCRAWPARHARAARALLRRLRRSSSSTTSRRRSRSPPPTWPTSIARTPISRPTRRLRPIALPDRARIPARRRR